MKGEVNARQIVEQMNIIDDTLFQKMAEDIGFCEEMISTILQQKVIVQKVTPQNSIKNLQGRSVVLDAICTLENGKECNVEVQKANDDDHQRRVRYNASCITANITDPGTKFKHVPDVISIFISKFDMFKSGETVYHIDRVVRETGEIQDNGQQEIYVNTKIDDGTDIAELMRIFKESDAYDFEKFPNVSKRKREFKESEGGETEVCELVEMYGRQCAEKATKESAKETAYNLLKNGASYELVKKSIMLLTDEELQEIYHKVTEEMNT